MKIIKWSMPFGMLSAIVYIFHVLAGQFLWKEYNPLTMDISTLTADGAPNTDFLKLLTFIYGVFFLIFVIGMAIKAKKEYHLITRIRYVLLLIMALISTVGYTLFPLTENKSEINFQNIMHIIVTVAVMLTTIFSIILISIGYSRKELLKPLGNICFIAALLIIIFGMTNPIVLAMKLNIVGLTERLVIFTLQAFIFFLSYIYTFNCSLVIKKKKNLYFRFKPKPPL